MFKTKRYFEAISIENNIKWHKDGNILTSGYEYTYIPVNTFLALLKDCVNGYNSDFPKEKLNLIVLASLDKQHAQFALVGQKKHIQNFITGLLTTEEIGAHWAISGISKYSVVHNF